MPAVRTSVGRLVTSLLVDRVIVLPQARSLRLIVAGRNGLCRYFEQPSHLLSGLGDDVHIIILLLYRVFVN
jgi:hypothetical protein